MKITDAKVRKLFDGQLAVHGIKGIHAKDRFFRDTGPQEKGTGLRSFFIRQDTVP